MRARKFRLKFFMTNKQTHVIVISFFIGILNIVSISLKAQGCIDVTPLYIQNAGFDEDLTWNADGSKKGEIVGTQHLSDRSIAAWTADSTVYATVNPTTPKTRPDGRTLEATNGFKARIKGWTLETNGDFPGCEWTYFGSFPYALGDEAIPVADDGSTYITVPAKPEENNTDDNIGFVYMRAGWGNKAIYKQTVKLPSGNYRLVFKTINLNPNGINGTNLSKVIDSNGNIFEDETGITSAQWTQHSISFYANGATTIQVGFESKGGSGSNPFLAIDDVKLYVDVINPIIYIKEDVFTYSGKRPTLSFANNEYFEIVDYDSLALQTDAGSYTSDIFFHIKDTGSEEIYEIKKPFSYTINKASLHVKANNVSREYGDENPNFSFEYLGYVNNEDQNVLTSVPSATTIATQTADVGKYPITISNGIAKNYTFVYEQGTLTITKAPLFAKIDNTTRQYGKENPTFTVTYTGLKNGETVPKWSETLKIATLATRKSDVGAYAITATGAPTNYELPNIEEGTLTITSAPLTVKANDAIRNYFEEDPRFTFTCIGLVNEDEITVFTKTPTFTTEAIKASNVGKYEITPSGAEAKNYLISYEKGELTITKRQLKVTSHSSRQYGEENPVLPIEYDGFVNDETEYVLSVKPVGTSTATKTSTVGDYPIIISGGEATNYDFVYEQGVLTVKKAALSAKVNDATKVYGENNPTFTIEYFGLKNGEIVPTWTTKPTFKTEATKKSGVGQYTISAVDGISVNYDLTINDGTLTITPAPLTIKANNTTRLYYSDNPVFDYTCIGFVNGEDKSVLTIEPTITTLASLSSNTGTYDITIDGATSPNYSISYAKGSLTITPRNLIASVGNYERIYNEDNPDFEITYEGFVGNDDGKVLNTQAKASTTATKTSDVGTYSINVIGGSDDNYKFIYSSGILTINKAEQTIAWDQDLSELRIGDQVELKAIASSGLPISYLLDNTNVAETYSAGNNTNYLDCKAEGQLMIRAMQEGNNNYYSTQRISKKATIVDAEENMSTLTIKQADNGSVSTKVNKGSSHTFTILVESGWKIHSVAFNNDDVTSQLDDENHYTTPAINENSTLTIIYEKEEVNAVRTDRQSSVKVQSTSFGVRVTDDNMDDMIMVYSADGIQQKSVKVEGLITDIPLSKDKVYIIKVGTKTVKLSL